MNTSSSAAKPTPVSMTFIERVPFSKKSVAAVASVISSFWDTSIIVDSFLRVLAADRFAGGMSGYGELFVGGANLLRPGKP